MGKESSTYKPGDKIGQYIIKRVLDVGRMGVIYEAEHPILDRRIAIKTLNLHTAEDPEPLIERLFQEAKLMSKLDHPNIAGLYDVGEHEGVPFLAMEMLSGRPLSRVIKEDQKPPIQVVLKIMAAIACALQHAHDNGIIHKDIKPGNIIIRPNGKPVLCNFGLSSLTSEDPLMEKGDIVGRPAFMSPEQVSGDTISPLSDIWSFGATLFNIIAMECFIKGKDYKEICCKITSPDPVDLSPLEGKAPEFVIDIVGKCLKKDPAERYQCAGDLRRALEAAVDHIESRECDAIKLATPERGQTLLLHVEYQEADLPGSYREYEIGAYIGSGTYGDVYQAEENLSGNKVALKILKHEWVSDEETVARFRREARVLSRFSHPNVLKVYNFGRYGTTFFIAMDLVPGQTLEDLLKEKGKLEVPEALPVMSDIFTGLEAIHEEGIVHRDLKPENISFKDDRVILCDFGLAHIEDMKKLTLSGDFLGSPIYTSPEQASGQKVSEASDVYSAGVIMYRMLSGKFPHDDASVYNLLNKIATEPPAPITKWRDDLHEGIIDFLERILVKDPQDRPSARKAKDMLEQIKV